MKKVIVNILTHEPIENFFIDSTSSVENVTKIAQLHTMFSNYKYSSTFSK